MKSTIRPYETTSQTALRSSQNKSIQAIKQNLPTGKTRVPDEGRCAKILISLSLGKPDRKITHTHTHARTPGQLPLPGQPRSFTPALASFSFRCCGMKWHEDMSGDDRLAWPSGSQPWLHRNTGGIS